MSFNGNNVLLIFVSCTSCFIVGSKCASLFPTVPQILREKVFPASFIFKKKKKTNFLMHFAPVWKPCSFTCICFVFQVIFIGTELISVTRNRTESLKPVWTILLQIPESKTSSVNNPNSCLLSFLSDCYKW